MQNDIQLQLEQVKEAWEKISSVPVDLTANGYPGLTKQSITNALGELTETATTLAKIDGYEPSPVSRNILLSHITNIRAYINTHIPPNPIPHIPGLLSLIEAIQNILRRWLDEVNKSGNSKDVISSLEERLANAMSQIKDVTILFEKIKTYHEALNQLATQANLDSSVSSQAKTNIGELLSTSQTSASQLDALLIKAEKNAEIIGVLTADFTNLKDELERNKTAQEQLFQEFENYRKQVSVILGDSNRAGMAGSFVSRKNELKDSIKLWQRVFVGAIVCLIAIAVFLISPSLATKHWDELLFRLPLSAPIIWLAWFAAKQYGYNIRLSEDYAYKAASAMAFEGFKRETTDEVDMRTKLLKTAIKNFGDNPIRIFDGKNNHASPVQELLQHLNKKGQLMDLLKSFVDKLPGK